ncbi:hypothetical protein [Paenibacillus cymbidii]|uniref:hypothetical protein n=1 Tax=Paenibacillus cymbidii TaxID=1639034 RepID=UPI0010806ACF|nr:hypothetical protein [Paenibacillus cymbidii]
MNLNSLMTSLSDREQELTAKLTKPKNNIQLLASNGEESCAIINQTMLDSYNLIIGIIQNDTRLCIGRYGEQPFSFPANQSISPTRVWIDDRGQGDYIIHFNCYNQHFEISHDQDFEKYRLLYGDEEININLVMIALLHCPKFVQLSVYDGRLAQRKSSHIIIPLGIASENLRILAHSMLDQHFPALSRYLVQLGGRENETAG